jgi:hypothetical protein
MALLTGFKEELLKPTRISVLGKLGKILYEKTLTTRSWLPIEITNQNTNPTRHCSLQ